MCFLKEQNCVIVFVVLQTHSKMSELSADDLKHYKETFSAFDKDGGGSINSKELGKAMQSLGANPTKKELAEMVAEVDQDGNGTSPPGNLFFCDRWSFWPMNYRNCNTHDELIHPN